MTSDALLVFLGSAFSVISPLVINLVLVLFLLLIGFLIARGIGNLLTFVLKIVQLDHGLKKVGFNALLEKGGVEKTGAELLGSLVY